MMMAINNQSPSRQINAPAEEVALDEALLDEADLRRQLRREGYIYLPGWQGDGEPFARSLGKIIKTTDVVVDRAKKSLVTSPRSLEVHTDHSRARYILWKCLAQSDVGGVSVLVDAYEVLSQLSPFEREALREVFLTEHKVFRGDSSRVPLLRTIDGTDRIYYSFWLLEDQVPQTCRGALHRFKQLLGEATTMRLRLAPGDLLVIDNHRMLHGRSAIEPQSERHLVRYWIDDSSPVEEAAPQPTSQPTRKRRGPKCPPRITESEITRFIEGGVDADVAALDLSMVKMKIQDPDEGKGWTPEQCDEVELEYKRYLTLNLRFPDHAVVPTKEMDQMWHYHILDTRAYHADCEKVFGEYFHHFPYFGMRSDDDERALESAFEETCALYRQEFGEDLLRAAEAQKCWHDCKGRCWHACKSD